MDPEQGELFPSVAAPPGDGPITIAAATTIEALRETGTLDASHSLKVELIMQGARKLDAEFRQGKVTIAAMSLYSKVVDIADGLPTVQQAVDAQFQAMTEALRDAD